MTPFQSIRAYYTLAISESEGKSITIDNIVLL